MRKKNILQVAALALALYTSAHFVASGQTAPPSGEASGICLIRNGHTSVPGFWAPDAGLGYAKVAKPGVNTFAGIREACAKSDFAALLQSYCAQNPTETGSLSGEVVGFDKVGNFLSSGGCPACDLYRCPLPPAPATEELFTFPIPELGWCSDAEACHVYCEKPENKFGACWAFAQQRDLISPDAVAKARKFAKVTVNGGGPGGCRSVPECTHYCENSDHLDECLVFAEKNGFFPPDELAQAKRFGALIKSGASPGGCQSKSECVIYCADENHSEECVLFLEQAGFVTQQEASLIRKFRGKSPGDCAQGKNSYAEARSTCNAFCNDPTNQPVCFRFLEEAGIMTAEEATQAGALSDFQACLPLAPVAIQQCFIDNLGKEIFEALQQGVLPLEENIEEFMGKIRAARGCVNRYADQSLEIFTNDPDTLSCINSELGADYLQKASRGEVSCGEAAPAQKRIVTCMEEKLGAEIDRCFSLTCSAATACLQKIQNQAETTPGNEVSIKSEIFTQLERKLHACAAADIRACLAKDCNEAIACIERLQDGAKGQVAGENQTDPSLEAEIDAKFTTCAKQEDGASPSSEQNQRPAYQTPVYEAPGNPSADQYLQTTDEPASPGLPLRQVEDEASQRGEPAYEIPITPELCANFASTPACSYTGSPNSQNYQLCKRCYPDR